MVTNDDPKARRGLEILQGKCKDHSQINLLDDFAKHAGSLARSSSEVGRRPRTRSGQEKQPTGLELGRQLLIILKTSGAGPDGDPVSSSQEVRVVDHGETQKEAIRRFFDAQTLIKGYEEHLRLVLKQVDLLQTVLFKVLRTPGAAVDTHQQEELRSLGISLAQRGDFAPGVEPVDEQGIELLKLAVDGPMTSESFKLHIPTWVAMDEHSRLVVEKFRKHLQFLFQSTGTLNNQNLIDDLWSCGYEFSQRWAGDPSRELMEKMQEMEDRFKQVVNKSLQETTMLRQQLRRLERRCIEGQALQLTGPQTGLGGAGKAGADAGGAEARSPGGRSRAGSTSPAHGEGFPSSPTGARMGLLEDDTLDINGVQPKDLDQMDNELFEPLHCIQMSMREVLIDIVNEKVRRILSLDPTKFKNGRLPYGLRPYKNGAKPEQPSGGPKSIEDLQDEYDRLKEEYDKLQHQLEMSHQTAASWRNKYQDAAKKLKQYEKDQEEPVPAAPEPKIVNVGPSEEEVGQQIAEAVAEATAELNKAHEEELAALRQQLQQARSKVQELESRPPEKIIETVTVPAPDSRKGPRQGPTQEELDEALKMIAEKKKALKQSIAMNFTLLSKVAKLGREILAVKAPDKYQKEVEEKLNGPKPASAPKPSPSRRPQTPAEAVDQKEEDHADTLPVMEAWTTETMKQLESVGSTIQASKDAEAKLRMELETVKTEAATAKGEAQAAAAAKTHGAPPPPPKVDDRELKQLRVKCKEQEDEIARLVITLDELRKRIESIQAAALAAGPGAASAIKEVMSAVGLKDMMEGKSLKNVFERLYEDAVQRIQRSALLQDQILLANKAYAAAVNAMSAEGSADVTPDFERLSATAAATLKGMWYRTEYLFRHACEYAMLQGVEASVVKAGRATMADLMESLAEIDSDFLSATGLSQDDDRQGRRGERPPRRGLQKLDGNSSFRQSGSTSPVKLKRAQAMADEATAFTAYMHALREARGDGPKEDWVKLERRSPSKADPLSESFPKTLRAACADSKWSAGPFSLNHSASLPALPKGRSLFQAGDSEESPSHKSPKAS